VTIENQCPEHVSKIKVNFQINKNMLKHLFPFISLLLIKEIPEIHICICVNSKRCWCKGFAKGSPHSILLAFSQSYLEHDLRKNKIVVSFFYQYINFMS
jgi:hypothetical protein